MLDIQKKATLGILFTGFLLFNMWILQSPWLGVPALLGYIVLFSARIRSTTSKKQGIATSLLLLLSAVIILNTILYYLYGTTKGTITIVLLLPLLLLYKRPTNAPIVHISNIFKKIQTWGQQIISPFKYTKQTAYAVLIAFFDTLLLAVLWLHRTTDLMASPWQATNAGFFLIFAFSTALLIYTILKSSSKHLSFALLSLHFFTMYAVAPILYSLGFGFDAFIHRATESWIFQHGFIYPKQPYYIGQYSLVALLSHITSLSVFIVDVYLVPLLSAIFIPVTVATSIAKRFNIKANLAAVYTLGLVFIPLLSFHLTTPHNLVILFSLLTVFLTLQYQKNHLPWYLPFSVSLAALVTHPLIGAPIFGFFLTAVLLKQTAKKRIQHMWLILSVLGQIILLPLLFTINNVRTGNGWPLFGNPFLELPRFVELFGRPYWYLENAPLFWELIYGWERLIVPLTVVIAATGFFLYKKKSAHEYLYLFTALGMFISAWLLRSWLTFPDVVVYEQGDYPLRLIRASLLFLLPWFLYGVHKLFQQCINILMRQRNNILDRIILLGTLIMIALFITLSFYFSYPQRNIKSRFPGFNVTASDFKAAEWIHNIEHCSSPGACPEQNRREVGVGGDYSKQTTNQSIDYIVLSNQLVAVAALTNYSFAKTYNTPLGEFFYYSIPTGGPMYKYYGQMLYEGQKRAYMEAAMDLVGVDTAYFVINNYWAGSHLITEGAKNTADSWKMIDDGKVWVFVYKK